MISLKNLSKSFEGEVVLNNVNMDFYGVTSLMGPSGSGKSTIIKLILGLMKPDKGSIIGNDISFSVMFQEDRLLEHLDLWRNLRIALGKSYDETLVKRIVGEVFSDEESINNKKIMDYSGGMKRRLALIRALLYNGRCIVLDEPFSGLDRKNKEIAMETIVKYRDNRDIIMILHDMEDAEFFNANIIYKDKDSWKS